MAATAPCLGFGVLTLLAALVAGCAKERSWGPRHEPGTSGGSTTSTGEGGAGGDLFPAGGGGSGELTCNGVCAPSALIPFERVTMVSIGTPENVRPCPESAPLVGFEGFADLEVAPHTCATCTCLPSSCTLPTSMSISAGKCSASEPASISWDPEAGWEGVCTSGEPIPAGVLCGGVPCVQSLTVGEPVVEPCVAVEEGAVSMPEASWGKVARECLIGPLSGVGCEVGEACAPVPAEGFSLCLFVKGDDEAYECPEGYPRREVVFSGVVDGRGCEGCACGEPEGRECAALVSAFGDAGCGQVVGSVMAAPGEEGCVDLLAGTGLGSKSALLVVDEPGVCAASGGAAVGEIAGAGAVTLCCQAEAGPAE